MGAVFVVVVSKGVVLLLTVGVADCKNMCNTHNEGVIQRDFIQLTSSFRFSFWVCVHQSLLNIWHGRALHNTWEVNQEAHA